MVEWLRLNLNRTWQALRNRRMVRSEGKNLQPPKGNENPDRTTFILTAYTITTHWQHTQSLHIGSIHIRSTIGNTASTVS